ncbi:MAG: CapA family protein [Saprospiraceae bacterium]|nr:CapA family protein [Saprospiraceae bacterium]
MFEIKKRNGQEKFYWWSSGLSIAELLELFQYRILTPRTQYKENFKYELKPGKFQIHSDATDFNIGFIGDLMPVNGKSLILSDELKFQLKGLDLLVVNFEGVITDSKRFLAQVHHPDILDKLRNIYHGPLILNVANNHSGDFGESGFYKHLEILQRSNFPVFGYRENPYYDIKNIRLYSSSLWSNQEFRVINRFNYQTAQSINQNISENQFNIFLPHWGYEMQRYPIKKHQNFAYNLLNDWDMIIGNHTHCPQPVELIPFENEHKIVAFSLGNFCYDIFNSNQWHGALLVAGMSFKHAKPKLVSCSYYFTHQDNPKKEIRIKLCDELNYTKRRFDMLDYLRF